MLNKYKRYIPAKERTLSQVHKKLQELDLKRLELLEANRDWFSRAPDKLLGDIFVRPEGKKPYTRRMLLSLNHKEHAISKDYPDKGNDAFFYALRDSELPLYINDEGIGKSPRKIIEDRLKGELFEVPFRQDLVDEYGKNSRQFSLLWALIRGYKEILIRYLRSKEVNNPVKRYMDPSEMILLEIDGYTYYFKNQRAGYSIQPIDPSSITTYIGGPDERSI